ncbi:family 78 glycoside hydrolase catalytic domain [Conexibacter sp. JD483]|uniref:family 78 glycoside hydrolase catalytic domain n=1 Tax=unclassified Conexibacter TaxID=2627773 RepID=UPI0027209B6F|nr:MULTISPECIES: family 78 glycoside hydrolase catalytic domain [unclassified Conexibacter]MDO8186075.1 family 78 glycoside hydrolase catalytic domain [Conexibacter sp. CPCC 205706]MDO8199565.1 family 78 glycoside hydrolase catalytic domain [Conexibacter sp. CPCC 205762]MDR9372421.1 family 78 glycoside hydrolase catalytic domain [Conexibacter sp. JD483]
MVPTPRLLRGGVVAAIAVAAVALPVAASGDDPGAGPSPTALNVELQPKPLVVQDLTAPKLAWHVRSDDADVVQRAYQVRVATTAAGLADGGTPLWDSGRVTSASSTGVAYAGPALSPGTRYRWSVRTWTVRRGADSGEQGSVSDWSQAAQFGTARSSWEATPIWVVNNDRSAGWTDYTVSAKLRIDAIAGGFQFRMRDASNGLMWQFRADTNTLVPHTLRSGTYATSGTATRMPTGISLGDGQTHTVAISAIGDTYTTSVDGTQVDQRTISGFGNGSVGFRNGRTEIARWDDLRVTAPDSTVLYFNDFSRAAGEIGCGTVAGGVMTVPFSGVCVLGGTADWAFLRGTVALQDKPIDSATLYATGSSRDDTRQFVYRTWVNGRLVGLGPTVAPRSGTLAYAGYDVTGLLRQGADNVLAAQAYTKKDQRFLGQLDVVYGDGTTQTFGTGASGWKGWAGYQVFVGGASIGTGFFAAPAENLDARMFPFGFEGGGFDDSGWTAVTEKAPLTNLVGAQTVNPVEIDEPAASVRELEPGRFVVDFGRAWIGGIRLHVANGTAGSQVDVRLGEELNSDGTVRYAMRTGNTYRDTWTLADGEQTLQHWGYRVFRYVELTNLPAGFTIDDVKATALTTPFDRGESSFSSDDPALDQVWQFTKNSIEALDFDAFMDSATRERSAEYGGDTYINLMAEHALSSDRALARWSTEYTAFRPSWPSEWRYATILAAWEDWQQTGDTTSLARQYDALRAFLPTAYVTSDGLLKKPTSVSGVDDLVDWPAGERDGYVFRQVNTVINAWAYRSFADMAEIASVLGKDADATSFAGYAARLRQGIDTKLWDADRGAYRDGLNDDGSVVAHWAVHASAFALAFGIPEPARAAKAAAYLDGRGMSCSVFCAQFVLQGLTNAGRADASIRMMTATSQRSWLHMIELGAGAVMEAWDPALKPNTSFSHPWASSPVVNVTKGIFGLAPAAPGWSRFTVAPQPGTLGQASIRTPTVRGEIAASFTNTSADGIVLRLTAPANTVAEVTLPRVLGGRDEILVDGAAVATTVDGDLLHADVGSGSHTLTVPQPVDTAPHTAFDVPEFPDQAQATIGPVRRVVVENSGISDLLVTRVRIKDADGLSTGDFVLSDESCTDGPIAPRATCEVSIRFAPGRENVVSHATLVLTDNTPAGTSTAALSARSGGLPQGPKGDDGERGEQGDPGESGPKGDRGDTGANGPRGDTGAPGAKGDTGASGANGAKGDTGAAGANGADGAPGAKGDKGDRGAAGRDAKVVCKLTRVKGRQRVSCTVSTAKAGKKAAVRSVARARLTRNGRTYASGRVGALRTTRTVARGQRYTLKVGGLTLAVRLR